MAKHRKTNYAAPFGLRPGAFRRFLGMLLLVTLGVGRLPAEPAPLQKEAIAAMKKAATYYRKHIAVEGGYVYFYSLDLKQRWGEGLASPTQIWVQPPGSPTVGMAYLKAHRATGDRDYLEAAEETAEALAYGQLRSGGWTQAIDMRGRSQGQRYSGGGRRREGNSSLDDGQTQSAIQLLALTDEALDFKNPAIGQAAKFALDSLLAAQFPNGGFPQVWRGPIPRRPVMAASYPDYDWKTENRIKNYWDMYTLNDNVCGYVAETLLTAHRVYGEERYRKALERLGDFLLLAQMPEPQPAWAQQYNEAMKPIWARKFEPPAIAGDESQEVIETLLAIHAATGRKKYLEPIPQALTYLKRSLLEDGRLARYYELRTNRPLYMSRRGKIYSLTYSDAKLPAHYGWKSASRLPELTRRYQDAQAGRSDRSPVTMQEVRRVIAALDSQGRWVSQYNGERLVGQAKMPRGAKYLSSETFSRNMTLLSEFLMAN